MIKDYFIYLCLIINIESFSGLYGFDSFISSDGVSLNYVVSGKGETLIMLHSGMMSRDDMQIQINYFSNYYKVIALDSREQGRSSSSRSQISYDLMSNDVIELMNHLEIDKTNIFGQSDGGITALITAKNHPKRILKFIAHGAVYHYNAYSEERRLRWKSFSWNEEKIEDTDPKGFPGMTIKSYLLGRKDLSQFENHLKEMGQMWANSPNLELSDLSSIKTPSLIIVGDHWDISLQHTIEMHEALPNSELFVVPNGTHFVHQEKPGLLHLVIHEFLKN